jgi:glucans biosynthesis protein C
MMLLGVVLHTALCFQDVPGTWLYQDPDGTPIAGLLVIGIHAFRMPVFFAMAGFFGALVVARRGVPGFLRRRFDRICVPLVMGWFLLAPLVGWSIAFAWGNAGSEVGLWAELRRTSLVINFADYGPMHLWFLWYLVLLYPVGLVLHGVARVLSQGAGRWLWGGVGAASIVCTFIYARSMGGPGFDSPESWIPVPHILLTYAGYFLGGWSVYGLSHSIHAARRWWPIFAGLGCATGLFAVERTIAFYMSMAEAGSAETSATLAQAQFAHAAVGWLATIGLAGLFERVLRRESILVRYFVDASYWIYLIHLPLTFFVSASLRHWDAPGLLKMTVAMAIVTALCVVTYELLVRRTVLAEAIGSPRTRS